MIMVIMRRELLEHSRSGRVLLLLALCVVLMPMGMYAASQDYGRRLDLHSQLVQSRQRRLLEVQKLPAHERMRWGWFAESVEPSLRSIRPPEPLSILASGLDARAPAFWQFTVSGSEAGPPPGDPTRLESASALDLSVTLQYLLSLLALLLTVDTVAAEREAGTLRATLSAPVPRAHVVIGKWLAAMIVCAATFIAGLGAGVIAAQVGESRLEFGIYAMDLSSMAVVGLVFLAAVASVGLFISTCARTARGALAVGLVAWAGLVFVQPRLIALATELVAPTESAEVLRERRETGIRAVARQRQRELARLWVSATGDAPVPQGPFPDDIKSTYQRARLPMEQSWFRLRRQVIRTVEDDALHAVERRRAVRSVLDLTGPVTTMTRALESIAGTGERSLANIVAQTESHQRQLERLAFDRTFGIEVVHPRYQLMMTWDADPANDRERAPSAHELPAFSPVSERTSVRVAGAIPSVLALASMAFLALVGASVMMIRRDVVL